MPIIRHPTSTGQVTSEHDQPSKLRRVGRDPTRSSRARLVDDSPGTALPCRSACTRCCAERLGTRHAINDGWRLCKFVDIECSPRGSEREGCVEQLPDAGAYRLTVGPPVEACAPPDEQGPLDPGPYWRRRWRWGERGSGQGYSVSGVEMHLHCASGIVGGIASAPTPRFIHHSAPRAFERKRRVVVDVRNGNEVDFVMLESGTFLERLGTEETRFKFG
jgi:hypothetical protein